MTTENIENHMAYTCKCGGVNFALLKSGGIECNKCSSQLYGFKWWAGGMGAQLARAIKAEAERDALQAKLDTAIQSSAHWQHQCTELQAKLSAMEAVEPQQPFGSKRKAAMAVYRPPFKYEHGYVYDSQNLMVADDGDIADEKLSVTGAVASRVRGWGRLSYLPNGAELQDEIGQMMADALNALLTAPKVAQQPLTDEWIRERCNQTWVFNTVKEWVRMIEEAHNIGGQQP